MHLVLFWRSNKWLHNTIIEPAQQETASKLTKQEANNFYYLTPFKTIFINNPTPTLFFKSNSFSHATVRSVANNTATPQRKFSAEPKNILFWHASSGGMAKQHCHATTSGVAGFDHARIDGVAACIWHVTGCGVAKSIRYGNKVGEWLLIKYFSKKDYLIRKVQPPLTVSATVIWQ